jgi:nitrogen fixation protein NifB
MQYDLAHHPCFNDAIRHQYGRIHLPVAPRCNVQCNFCNRKFDCVNESRPGVTSTILSPQQALHYLDLAMTQYDNLAVVGIAGPGDPFANPRETLETLHAVHERYPQLLLCVATNGLAIVPYIDTLAECGVSHVTITVNAVDVAIAAKVYAWIRLGKRITRSEESVKTLLDNQLTAIRQLKEHDILVKINSIIMPGINDRHIVEVAKTVASLGADIFNAIPLYRNLNSAFSHIPTPTKALVTQIRNETAPYLPQMHHCTRCRADAVGLLGAEMDTTLQETMRTCAQLPDSDPRLATRTQKDKPYIAVASMEGVLVNQHLGEATELLIFESNADKLTLIDKRKTPTAGTGTTRWETLAQVLKDCSTLLVSGVGNKPKVILEKQGIHTLVIEGVIEEALNNLGKGMPINHLMKRTKTACGQSCSGSASGCG